MGFGSSPSYTPPPAAPPAAAPPTLATSSVASTAASRQNAMGAAYGDTVATSPEGINPMGVATAKQTLGGVT